MVIIMNSYLHNKKRQKELRKKYLLDKKEKKKKIKYIDKLFIRIFFSSLLLLIVTYFTSFDNKFKNKITNAFDEHINFLQLTNKVDSLFLNKLFNKGDITVYSKAFYEQVEYKNGVNYVSNSSTSAVESLVDGVVIKIEKANNLYSVYIQSIDDVIYEFRNLEPLYHNPFVSRWVVINESTHSGLRTFLMNIFSTSSTPISIPIWLAMSFSSICFTNSSNRFNYLIQSFYFLNRLIS